MKSIKSQPKIHRDRSRDSKKLQGIKSQEVLQRKHTGNIL